MPHPFGKNQDIQNAEDTSGFTRRDFFKFLAARPSLWPFSTERRLRCIKTLKPSTRNTWVTNRRWPVLGRDPESVPVRGRPDHDEQRDGRAHAQAGLQHLDALFQAPGHQSYDVYNFLPTFKEATRAKLASFIHATPEEVVLSTTPPRGSISSPAAWT